MKKLLNIFEKLIIKYNALPTTTVTYIPSKKIKNSDDLKKEYFNLWNKYYDSMIDSVEVVINIDNDTYEKIEIICKKYNIDIDVAANAILFTCIDDVEK